MRIADLVALLPFILIGITVVLTLLTTAFHRSHRLVMVISVAGLAGSILSLVVPWELGSRQVTGLLLIDRFGIFYSGLVMAAALATVMLAYGYLQKCAGQQEEFYILLLLATLGSMALVASNHLVSFFLGFEILSVSLYTLISYRRGSAAGAEAGVKYLILGAVSSAFLVFGLALIYFETGSIGFTRVATGSAGVGASAPVVSGALALVLVAVGFKLSLAPFHMWVADVFEGSPAPVAGFIATVSKGAVFALILRYFATLDLDSAHSLLVAFTVIATVSMFVGNLLALAQQNVKRMLAYSSIAHMGYLLVAFLASGPSAPVAVTFYLVAYFIATLIAFGAISVLSENARDAADLDNYRGLAWRRPWLAAGFTLSLLSLAGIPLTAGFIGKFYVVMAGAESHLWMLIGALVVNSAIGLFYYLRVVATVYSPQARVTNAPVPGRVAMESSIPARTTLVVLTVLLIWFGVNPSALIRFVMSVTASLSRLHP
jgi:NADH-quinone oxidoreductase subunit N